MNRFQYGSQDFEWCFEEADLKRHTVTVEKGQPVLLRGQAVDFQQQEQLIRKRARWICEKRRAVAAISESDIVSGSRISYLGRRYMLVVVLDPQSRGAAVQFNGSKFRVTVDPAVDRQMAIQRALDRFMRKKAEARISSRLRHWEQETGLQSNGWRIFKFPARWGSCNKDGQLEFHPRCIELAPTVLDYVIVHELVHLIEMQHTKTFWKLVSEYFPNWETCHRRLDGAL